MVLSRYQHPCEEIGEHGGTGADERKHDGTDPHEQRVDVEGAGYRRADAAQDAVVAAPLQAGPSW